MYKVGVIGNGEGVLGFMALGFTVQQVDTVSDAVDAVKKMVKSGEYATVFILEEFAEQMQETLSAYKDLPLPAIVTIPGEKGSTGFGINAMRNAVERAVGADILFSDKK